MGTDVRNIYEDLTGISNIAQTGLIDVRLGDARRAQHPTRIGFWLEAGSQTECFWASSYSRW